MAATKNEHIIRKVPADRIRPGNNDRTTFDPDALVALAESIAENDLQQPIILRVAGDAFEIVAGERRFRACTQILGWDRVPAIVRSMDDRKASAVMLTENTARQDLNPVEEMKAYRSRLDAGYSLDDVSAWAGKDKGTITWLCRLADLIPDALHLVETRQLTPTQGWHIARLDENRQRIALRALASEHLSTDALARLVTRLENEAAAEPMFDDTEFLQIEEWAAEEAARTAARRTRSQLIVLLAEASTLLPAGPIADRVTDALSAEK